VLKFYLGANSKAKIKKTWKSGNFPYNLHGGMIQYVGHSDFQWEVREQTSELFGHLWGVEKTNLATSFDGFCFMAGERKYKKRADNSFIHTDQNPNRNYVWSYQGLLNLVDCDEKSGGFVCVPKTHLKHREFFETRYDLTGKKFKKDWYLFSDEEKEDEEILSQTIKVNCNAGDMILWDSRTFHCNTVPTKSVTRACVYVCMLPKEHLNKEIRTKRRNAFELKRCCTHHPGDGFTMFPPTPRWVDPNVYKKLISKVTIRKLNEIQLSLACID